MKFFEDRKKRKAIKSYLRVIPPLLKDGHGPCKEYTAEQVRRTVESAGLDQRYLYYAFAMFMSQDAYNELTQTEGLVSDYMQTRQFIADGYFDGAVNFTFQETCEFSQTSEGLIGGDGGHDDWGGDDGGGD